MNLKDLCLAVNFIIILTNLYHMKKKLCAPIAQCSISLGNICTQVAESLYLS